MSESLLESLSVAAVGVWLIAKSGRQAEWGEKIKRNLEKNDFLEVRKFSYRCQGVSCFLRLLSLASCFLLA